MAHSQMLNLMTIVTIVCFVQTRRVLAQAQHYRNRGRLMRELLRSYDRDIAPGEVHLSCKNVEVHMIFVTIVDLDTSTLVLESIIWLQNKYTDPRLTWNPSQFDNISTLHVPQRHLWIPDVELYNAIDRPLHLSMTEHTVIVDNSGSVFHTLALKVKTRCSRAEGHDEFVCSFSFGSWVYNGEFLDVVNSSSTVGLSNCNAGPTRNWEVIDSKMWRDVLKFDCSPDTFPQVHAQVTLNKTNGNQTLNHVFG